MEGPYRVLEKVGNAYRLELPPAIKVHPVIAASLRRAADDPVPGQHPEVNGEAEWEVERILASRLLRKRTLQYRAKWMGYSCDKISYDTDPE
jgi:hypothetical protein